MNKLGKIFTRILVFLLFLNVAFLDFRLFEESEMGLAGRVAKLEEWVVEQARPTQESQEDTAVMVGGGEFEEDKLEAEIEEVEVSPTQAPELIHTPVASSSNTEIYIPLGSGSTISTEWSNTGAQAYIDTKLYPNLKEAYFQASLRSNSGAVEARLWQNNERAYVPGSQIMHNIPASTFITSEPINLSLGNKLYVVQVRSETGQEVFVENARVRLVIRE